MTATWRFKDRLLPFLEHYPQTKDILALGQKVPQFSRLQLKSWKPDTLVIYIPFCRRHCGFCALNTTTTQSDQWRDTYLDLLVRDFRNYSKVDLSQLDYIYVTGGTPNFFGPQFFTQLFHNLGLSEQVQKKKIHLKFEMDPRLESVQSLAEWYKLGVAEIVWGVQELNLNSLVAISRHFETEKVTALLRESVRLFKTSVDWMIGIPNQDPLSISKTLLAFQELKISDLQLYRFTMPQWIDNESTAIDATLLKSFDEISFLWKDISNQLQKAGFVPQGFGRWSKQPEQLNWGPARWSFSSQSQVLGLGLSTVSFDTDGIELKERKLNVYKRNLERNLSGVEAEYLYSEEDQAVKSIKLRLNRLKTVAGTVLSGLVNSNSFHQGETETYLHVPADKLDYFNLMIDPHFNSRNPDFWKDHLSFNESEDSHESND